MCVCVCVCVCVCWGSGGGGGGGGGRGKTVPANEIQSKSNGWARLKIYDQAMVNESVRGVTKHCS